MTEFEINSSGLAECAARVRKLIGGDDPDSRASSQPHVKVGLGLAFCGMKNSGVHSNKDVPDKVLEFGGALVKVNEDGSVGLNIASIEQGGGQATALTQIVADSLGVPFEGVTVVPTDTDSAPYDAPTPASRITFAAGHSARLAALDAREKILEAAGRMMDVEPAGLQLADGVVSSRNPPAKSLTMQEVAEYVHYKEMQTIVGSATSKPPGNPPSFGVLCAKVAVDEETGVVKVLEMVDAHDIGRVVNPIGATGQVTGAFAQGIGMALSEHLVIDEASGALVSPDLESYEVPTALDVPEGIIEFVETDDPAGIGTKGVAESALHGPVPAIANAVYDAVGVRVRRLPVLPADILEGIRQRSS